MYPLPLFSLLNIDRDTYGTMLEELCRSAPEEFQKALEDNGVNTLLEEIAAQLGK